MDALRSFLSGRRLAIIGILLAIPFVFFGSSSFGTVFTNYGKVNGLTVSALDVNKYHLHNQRSDFGNTC